MTDRRDRQYNKLLQALNDPVKKDELHEDPDVGHILRKLSVNDVQELQQIAQHGTKGACPPGIGDA
ncbi:MAG: hypothetical protein J2P53_04215 [Bradyrhizobiaceae bacterium]|nr:hypothetical protein [Bradyrhizobiaceae bacterium]